MKKPIVRFILSFIIAISPQWAYSDPMKRLSEKKNRKTLNQIELAISAFNPKLDRDYVKKIAVATQVRANEHKLDPMLLVSIINAESSFNQSALSSTNDISIVQINPSVWTPEYFKKVTGENLNLKKLKTDEAYAIARMCLILSYYKKNYPNDKKWFARYHSGNQRHKNKYALKIEKGLSKIYALSHN